MKVIASVSLEHSYLAYIWNHWVWWSIQYEWSFDKPSKYSFWLGNNAIIIIKFPIFTSKVDILEYQYIMNIMIFQSVWFCIYTINITCFWIPTFTWHALFVAHPRFFWLYDFTNEWTRFYKRTNEHLYVKRYRKSYYWTL